MSKKNKLLSRLCFRIVYIRVKLNLFNEDIRGERKCPPVNYINWILMEHRESEIWLTQFPFDTPLLLCSLHKVKWKETVTFLYSNLNLTVYFVGLSFPIKQQINCRRFRKTENFVQIYNFWDFSWTKFLSKISVRFLCAVENNRTGSWHTQGVKTTEKLWSYGNQGRKRVCGVCGAYLLSVVWQEPMGLWFPLGLQQ